jgi:nickel superoxide dismutase
MMRRAFAIGTAAVGGLAALRRPADMHCQVPCGIYNEQLRLDAMAEDAQTVRHRFSSASVRCCRPRARSSQRVCRSVPARCAQIRKAMVQINDLAGSSDAKAANQLVRWISTKEEHASKIQKTVAEVRT